MSTPESLAMTAARLRDRLSTGVVEHWTGPIPADVDTRPLHHLPPPAPGADGGQASGDPRIRNWQATFRPALCYYRVGPGFIQVKDIRDPATASRVTISQQPLIDAIMDCERPVRLAGQDRRRGAALDFLLAECLLLRFGDLVTTAPYRMRRWPLPARLG